MIFYKHFIGDYARDTSHLTLAEHGAYRLMLDTFYGTARPLPSEKRSLYRLLRAENDTERKAVDSVAQRFWRTLPHDLETIYALLGLHSEDEQDRYKRVAASWTECGLINVRALGEIVRAAAIADKNRKIAFDREAKRRDQARRGGIE